MKDLRIRRICFRKFNDENQMLVATISKYNAYYMVICEGRGERLFSDLSNAVWTLLSEGYSIENIFETMRVKE